MTTPPTQPAWFHRNGEQLLMTLHVQPGAKRNEIIGLHGEALKIKLAAPAIDGRANDALLRFVAECFAVPLRDVALKLGGQSRHKVVTVNGSTIAPESLLPQQRPMHHTEDDI